MINGDLTLLQKEISAALRQLKNRNLITEAQLIKKIRENVKFFGKNKASLPLNDIEIAIKFLEETDEDYIRQIQSYNEKSKHDDCPDSASSVIRLLEGEGVSVVSGIMV